MNDPKQDHIEWIEDNLKELLEIGIASYEDWVKKNPEDTYYAERLRCCKKQLLGLARLRDLCYNIGNDKKE